MRKIFKLSFVVVLFSLLFTSTSCDKIKDASTFDIEPAFTSMLECKVPAILNVTNTAVYSGSAVIDPRSDSKVNVYLNSIQGYEIKSITATITSLSRNSITLISGDLILKNFNREIKWSLKNELLSVGKTLTLTNDKDQLNLLSQSLKDGQEIGVISTGVADFSDISFTIKIEIKAKAEVKLI
ncbi:MAG: hypothetical protein JZU47_00340 [Prolixibacteraceae bacterium]|nr:hypothetical protein [Prolixibacteraceae bacterium]